jgi:uncharacterized phage protein (TIGR01671 family)
MSREIKFRAWDSRNNEMRYSDRHDGEFYINLKGVLYMYKVPNADKYFKCYNVMQYTGLKDRNGKKIYEDDVVKQGWQTLFVSFSNGEYRFVNKLGRWEQNIDTTEMEVIGNIYENPELL